MIDTIARLMDRAHVMVAHLYAERQIYLRSHGHVQFISLSPIAQIGMAAIAVGFLSWVAFTSVNVVFKEQIIASKDRRFVKVQAAYEERIAQMQASYDDLNGQLILAQERFIATTQELEAKHDQIADVLSHREAAVQTLTNLRTRIAETQHRRSGNGRSNKVMMSLAEAPGAPRVSRSETVTTLGTADRGSSLFDVLADETPLMFGGLLRGSVFGDRSDVDLDTRLSSLNQAQQSLINAMEETTDKEIRELEQVIALTGVTSPEEFMERVDAGDHASGGPYIDLVGSDGLAGGGTATSFNRQVRRIAQNLDHLAALNFTVGLLPLASPLETYRATSSFGPRMDPFKGRMAFHSGHDMGAPYNTPVYAPAPGVVTYADWRGPYGRMIEVDHGNGFRTRYAHLNKINVSVGEEVSFQDLIGKVGSSGRSSGPHLHYEVWFDDQIRDPSKFIEAGRYVFTHEG
ncbi:MAG: hypothetical protein CMI60_01460 [Parvibaculum sp.]|jgi:murein DD-endopeptidase MepM/ murein hydrolase activator NlpD|nr:hypothetical protein [Parvibaculum sp.]|tara:strand:+ start:653 stop:2032 length:1380 start_codon:yes stop_codon:yes gene_type:complete